MTDRPILFSGPMVRALLDGRKTQTRRVLRQQPPTWANFCQEIESYNALHQWVPAGLWWWAEVNEARDRALRWWPLDDDGQRYAIRPPAAIGDRLWVRETWQSNGLNWRKSIRDMAPGLGPLHYAATDSGGWKPYWGGWKPGIHLPRWASRLTLAVTEVRVERLQDISEADAIAEGCGQYASSTLLHRDRPFDASLKGSYREGFSELWEGLNAKRGYGWDTNPWCYALTFTVHHQNIDAPGAKEAA